MARSRRKREQAVPPPPIGADAGAAAVDDDASDLEPEVRVLAGDEGDAEDAGLVHVEVHEGPAAVSEPLGASEPLVRVTGLESGYGALKVLYGIDMAIYPGETAVLLGLNGAGKTTTVLNICGAVKTWAGSITYDGQDATGWSIKQAVDAGIVMVPEGRRVFPDLSVAKNLQVGAWARRSQSGWIDEQRDRVYEYFPRLRERAGQLAGTLSGGEQQMLAIGRGLMAGPRLLIIDEASLGLAPVIVKDVFDIVSQINKDGTTVIMVEQNVGALSVADVGYVMEKGQIIAEVRGDELSDPSRLRKLFLG